MSVSKPMLFVDTCVWLDLYLPGRSGGRAAQELVRYALDRDIPLAYASHSALDVYAKAGICAKRLFREGGELTDEQARAARTFAWDCATQMRELAMLVPADVSDFYYAEKFRPLHGDLEDDLVLAGCARARANYLVTTDKRLLRHADVAAKTPTEMLALLTSPGSHASVLCHNMKDRHLLFICPRRNLVHDKGGPQWKTQAQGTKNEGRPAMVCQAFLRRNIERFYRQA